MLNKPVGSPARIVAVRVSPTSGSLVRNSVIKPVADSALCTVFPASVGASLTFVRLTVIVAVSPTEPLALASTASVKVFVPSKLRTAPLLTVIVPVDEFTAKRAVPVPPVTDQVTGPTSGATDFVMAIVPTDVPANVFSGRVNV